VRVIDECHYHLKIIVFSDDAPDPGINVFMSCIANASSNDWHSLLERRDGVQCLDRAISEIITEQSDTPFFEHRLEISFRLERRPEILCTQEDVVLN
jgi:hypothetical protein